MTETQAPAPILRMVEATNAGDRAGFVACFTTDAYLEDWGRAFHGHAGVTSWDESDNIGKQMHFTIISAQQDDDEWAVSVRASGNGFNGDGNIRFTLEGDLISRMVLS